MAALACEASVPLRADRTTQAKAALVLVTRNLDLWELEVSETAADSNGTKTLGAKLDGQNSVISIYMVAPRAVVFPFR